MKGYGHRVYAESLAEFGTPRELPQCGGWILERQIAGFPYHDGMGCYPLFACQDWSQLCADMENIGRELVSLSMVTDPFGLYDVAYLQRCFRDIVLPFKEHYIVDLSRELNTFVSRHHRRNVRKALCTVHVEVCENPMQFIDEWVDLYSTLIRRHNIRGIPAFSRLSFAKQLTVPGIVMFRAMHGESLVGMTLWYIQGDVVYYHLGAYNDLGYRLGASFALLWYVIEYFADNGLRWLNLGAGPGVKSKGVDGLTRFKLGWSTATRTAYFCGRIFDEEKYLEIVKANNVAKANYFPVYRKGEFD